MKNRESVEELREIGSVEEWVSGGLIEKVTFEQRLETESSESHGSGVWGRPVRGAGVKARGREGLNGQEPE